MLREKLCLNQHLCEQILLLQLVSIVIDKGKMKTDGYGLTSICLQSRAFISISVCGPYLSGKIILIKTEISMYNPDDFHVANFNVSV